MDSMRAIVQHEFGGPEVLEVESRPVPEPVATEVRVRVEAAGVNPVDWKTRAGKGAAAQFGPAADRRLGRDGRRRRRRAGRHPLRRGRSRVRDAVVPAAGGRLRRVRHRPVAALRPPPRRAVAVEQAAGLSLAGLTAWQCLVDIAQVQPGQRVLIHAAAGGVGHLAVQIAKARGAHVIGTASAAKHDLLAELGVDEAVDYRSQKFEDVVEPVDVVYDLIGGDVAERSLDVLRPDGIQISLPSAAAAAAVEAARPRGLHAVGMMVEPDGDGLEELAALVEAGRLRVLVDETFPLDQAADAHRLGEEGRTTGKIVLTVLTPAAAAGHVRTTGARRARDGPGEVIRTGSRQPLTAPSGVTTNSATAERDPASDSVGQTKLPSPQAIGRPR